jgi:polyhydroxyalkanoate synthesis regulator phasin
MSKKYTMEEFKEMFANATIKAQEEIDKKVDESVKDGTISQEDANKMKMSNLLHNLMYSMELSSALFGDK